MAHPELRRIVHQNGATIIERVIRERVVSTSDWLNELQKSAPSPSRLLPPDCIDTFSVRRRDNIIYRTYVTMMQAHVQPCQYRARDARTSRLFNLSWPATLWWFMFTGQNLTGVYLTAVKRLPYEVENLTELELFKLPMPNQYVEGQFCLGNVEVDVRLPEWKRGNQLRNNVLNSNWNDDLMPDFTGMPYTGLVDWDAKTRDTPSIHVEATYKPFVYPTYRTMVEFMTSGGR